MSRETERRSIEQRLAEKDRARRELRTEQMKGVGNWPVVNRKGE